MALVINIDDLINARTVESVRIEFKTGWNPYSILKTVCAFANDIDEYGGGYIIIGIEEKEGIPVLPPVGIPQNKLDSIQKEFFTLCQNDLKENFFPSIESIEYDGKWILVIQVHPGETRPYQAADSGGKNAKTKVFVRHGTVTKEATRLQLERLRELASIKHFDDKINPKATIDDLDMGLILTYLQEIKSQLYKEAQSTNLLDLCLKMQIVRGPSENIRPLNLGLLLFCKTPEKYFEGAVTNLVEFEDHLGKRYTEKQFKGPIHIQIKDILHYLESSIIKQIVIKEGTESRRFFNYPIDALREIVVNAFYHRSYEDPRPNEIRIQKFGNDPHIAVLSYPGPMPPIDEQALAQFSILARNYRNLKLGEKLKELRLAEKYATGMPTILEAMIQNASPRPRLSVADTHFMILLPIHPDTPIEQANNVVVESINLTSEQQESLEKFYTPIFESEIRPEDQKLIDFFLETGLIDSKKMTEAKVYFITDFGRETLKGLF